MSVKGISKLLLTGLLSQGLCRLRLLKYLLPTYSRAVDVVSEEHFAVVFKISGYTKMHSIVHVCTFIFRSVSKLFIMQRSKVFTTCFLCCLFMHIIKNLFCVAVFKLLDCLCSRCVSLHIQAHFTFHYRKFSEMFRLNWLYYITLYGICQHFFSFFISFV